MWALRLFRTRRFLLPKTWPRPIPLRLEHLEQLPAPGEERVELLGFRVGDRAQRGAHHLGEAGEEVGVDAIGLRELARRLGEVADLARVHHDYRERHGGEAGDREQLVVARGFQHDQLRRDRPQPLDERAEAPVVIRQREPLGAREHADH
jgi:hypothetical protein